MRFLGGARHPHGGARGGAQKSLGGSRGGARPFHGDFRRDLRPSSTHHLPIDGASTDPSPQPQEVRPSSIKNSPVKDGVSFAEVVRNSPPSENPLPSLKRRRPPENKEVCKRCLRSGHKVEDCRH